ncbi:PhzF family phenazine biosynthesis protein [Thalassiella azotivora]
MAQLEFEVVDVFTRTPFTGNPLAVVTGGEDLTTAQMQALAREFHLSETAFPLRPTPAEAERGVDYRLRIFTPTTELPFAGHPSVGTAWLMAARGRVRPGRVVQACGAGDLPLDVSPDGGPVTLTGGTPTLGRELDGAAVAATVGLDAGDLAGHVVREAGTGNEFAYLLVRPEAVPRAHAADTSVLGTHGVYVVGWPADASAGPVRARLFAGDIGVAEDPATGSAALGLAVHAVACGLLPGEGVSRFEVLQGVELGRPSTLRVEVEARDGRAVAARVTGDVVPVSRGTVAVPPA